MNVGLIAPGFNPGMMLNVFCIGFSQNISLEIHHNGFFPEGFIPPFRFDNRI